MYWAHALGYVFFILNKKMLFITNDRNKKKIPSHDFDANRHTANKHEFELIHQSECWKVLHLIFRYR